MIEIPVEIIGAAITIILVIWKLVAQYFKNAEQMRYIEILEDDLEKSQWALKSLLKTRDTYRTAKADGVTTPEEKIACYDKMVPFLDFVDENPWIDTLRSASE